MNTYKYDVFLSWTGKDENLKKNVKQLLEREGFSCYDSQIDCRGAFRENYVDALMYSKVYLILMSDNLRNNPNESGTGMLTEVRKEVEIALDLDSRGVLNVELLNFSEYFCYKDVYRNTADQMGMFFYSRLCGVGFSRVDALDGLTDEVSKKLVLDISKFVQRRNDNNPVVSVQPKLGVEIVPFRAERAVGRGFLLTSINIAWSRAKIIALYGMDGIGKLSVAKCAAKAMEEEQSVICPQIINVQNQDYTHFGSVFKMVVASTAYSPDAIHHNLPEEEKMREKENILRNLPSNVLLIVSNVAVLTGEDIAEFASKLKCKVLFTTRVKPECKLLGYASFWVTSLLESSALKMFNELCQQEISLEDFLPLYRLFGGHTLALCLVAKAMKTHKKSLAEMLQEYEITGEFSENVKHRDGGDNVSEDAVSQHLAKLFGLRNTQMSKNSQSVLRNLALLASGKIPCKLLCQQLGMTNRNDILSLCELGLVTLNEQDFVCMHPMISQLVNSLFAPTAQNAQAAVQYLVQNAQAVTGLSFGDVQVLFGELFFALLRIAKNQKTLCLTLWEKFEKAGRFVSDFEKLKTCCQKLCEVLQQSDTAGARKVQLFCDSAEIEHYPTKVEVIAPYLANLETSAEDYAFVMRALSIVGEYVISCGDRHIVALMKTLNRALEAAIAKDDCFAVYAIAANCMVIDLKHTNFAAIKKFIRKHKKEKIGSVMLLEYIVDYFAMLGPNALKEVLDILNDESSRKINSVIRKHPIAMLKLARKCKKIENLSEEDELYGYTQLFGSLIDKYVDDDNMDLETLVKIVQELYLLNVEHKLTLQSFFQVFSNFIEFAKSLPLSKQGQLQQLVRVDAVDPNNCTMEQYSNLCVAYEINCALQNEQAVILAKNILLTEQHRHDNRHIDVISARLKLANAYVLLGQKRNAWEQFVMAFQVFRVIAANTHKLLEVCNAMLVLLQDCLKWLDFKKYNVNHIKQIAECALDCCEPFSSNALLVQLNYLTALKNFVFQKEIENRYFEIWNIITANVAKYTQNYDSAVNDIIGRMYSETYDFISKGWRKQAQKLLQMLRNFGEKQKKRNKNKAMLCYYTLKGYDSYCYGENENAKQWCNKGIDFGVKHNLNCWGACTRCMQYLLLSAAQSGACNDNTSFVSFVFGKSFLEKMYPTLSSKSFILFGHSKFSRTEKMQTVVSIPSRMAVRYSNSRFNYHDTQENFEKDMATLTREKVAYNLIARVSASGKVDFNTTIKLKKCKNVIDYKLQMINSIGEFFSDSAYEGFEWIISLATVNDKVVWQAELSSGELKYEFKLRSLDNAGKQSITGK